MSHRKSQPRKKLVISITAEAAFDLNALIDGVEWLGTVQEAITEHGVILNTDVRVEEVPSNE